MVGSYDYGVVSLSIVIAVVASYAALELAERLSVASGRSFSAWLGGGSTAMAIGIWSMHYTGMLAFRLPVPVRYDWPTALLSFIAGLLASIVALWIASRPELGSRRAVFGSFFMGSGIVALHYTAMESMRAPLDCQYDPALVALSVALAIVFSLMSLSLTFLLRREAKRQWLRRIASALLMGAAICAMHYTGMAAASFAASERSPDLSHAVRISALGIAGIGSVTMTILAIVVVTAIVDRLHHQHARLDAVTDQLRALSARLRSVREEEGTRIARELHDELGANLTSLKWSLEGVEKLLSAGNEVDAASLREKIPAMTTLVDVTVSAVRRISSQLRPSLLDDLGLVDAIEWQASQFQSQTGISCHLEIAAEDVALDPERSTAVFRVLQEALTNVLRHARATSVEIEVRRDAGRFVLTIRDDGRGITHDEKTHAGSLGILGMRERTRLIGAELEIIGVEGRGTTLILRVPLSE